ncbi:hypothetical protein [Phenylobacterium sp.]|uniref:hypothetical protein n=1 Tax=Phenylobacterium sp. TaxID=1871053 RepID=UPI002F3F784E
MQLVWRIYAVVYLVLFVVGLSPALRQLTHLSPIDVIDMIIFMPIAVFGLWSSAYRHINLPKNGWKTLLFASVFWRPITIGNDLLFNNAVPKYLAKVGALTVGMRGDAANAVMLLALAGACLGGSLMVIPPLVALYRNAYGDESLLKLMSPGRVSPQQTAS